MNRAVTIDFHDTLFVCDEWFELEVRGLLPEFLKWHARASGASIAEETTRLAAEHYRVLREQIIEHGLEQDAHQCVRTVCTELGIEADPSAVGAGLRELMRATLLGARPREGAVELVGQLRECGVRLGIVSNAIYHPFLEWALAAHGLAEAFDVVTTSASAGYYKSRAEIYQLTLERLDVSPHQAIHIGDSYRFDVVGAARAGMGTVWLDLKREAGPEHNADLITCELQGLAPRVLAALDRRSNG